MGNHFLTHIRGVDAILHVVRCFEDPAVLREEGPVNPVSDIEIIDTELMLADLQVVESAIDKARRNAKSGDKDAKARLALLEKCQPVLAEGQPVRTLIADQKLDPDELKQLKSLGLITAKKVLYVANVDEDDLHGEGPLVQQVRDRAAAEGGAVVTVCAKLEAELAELDGDDQREMLDSLGLDEPALASVARAAYDLLGLKSYFTAGEKEVRAWTIPHGRHRAPGRGRDPLRLRAGLHPCGGLPPRRPGTAPHRKGDPRGGPAPHRGQGLPRAGRRHLPLPHGGVTAVLAITSVP